LGTAGGSIRVGIDPMAPLTLVATRAEAASRWKAWISSASRRRSHVSGTINGGQGGSFRASTSGGNITLRPAIDPGVTTVSYARR
jgi:hypothetical protein